MIRALAWCKRKGVIRDVLIVANSIVYVNPEGSGVEEDFGVDLARIVHLVSYSKYNGEITVAEVSLHHCVGSGRMRNYRDF